MDEDKKFVGEEFEEITDQEEKEELNSKGSNGSRRQPTVCAAAIAEHCGLMLSIDEYKKT